MTSDNRAAYSVEETANLLGVSIDTVTKLINSGKLRSFKAERRRLISATALTEYIAAAEADAA